MILINNRDILQIQLGVSPVTPIPVVVTFTNSDKNQSKRTLVSDDSLTTICEMPNVGTKSEVSNIVIYNPNSDDSTLVVTIVTPDETYIEVSGTISQGDTMTYTGGEWRVIDAVGNIKVTTSSGTGGGTVTSIHTAGMLVGGTITTSGTISTSVATGKLIGRSTAGTGVFEPISIGTGLSLSGGTLSATSSSGTVTSVAMTTPTGLTVTGGPITTSGTLALSLTSGYVIPTTTEETNWNTAYTNRITSLTTSGTSGAATLIGNVLNIPQYTDAYTGTVTSVSVVTANGVSGSVANATTTPAITLTLGAITPSSVNSVVISGSATPTLAVTGTSSISGSNTGDQTITLTGDVTGSGTGSFAATIANNAVTYAKMQDVSAVSKLLGSSSTTTPVQEITLGSGLSLSGTTLSATGTGGTVTSVAMTTPTGLTVTGSPITTSGTLALALTNGYVIPTTTEETNWNSAYTDRITSASAPLGISSHVISITQATTSTDGYLSSTDWNTFNNKQSALTLGNITDAGTDGITVTGGTGAIIGSGVSLSQHVADSTHNGYLSSTDWTTFNSKGSGTVTSVSVVTANGVSGTVATATTTPAITLALGAITPSSVTIGTLTYSPTNTLISAQSSVNAFNQVILQNSNAGGAASSDLVVNNDQSTNTTYYGDFGMNSSGFTGTGSFNAPNAVYLSSTSADLVIGTTTSNAIRFVVNSGTTDALVIGTTGAITTGTWNGSVVGAAYGGTGVANNALSTLTISGNFGTTLTVTGTTSVTLPTSGTLVNTAVTTLSSLTAHGTITSGGLGSGAVIGGVTMTLGSDASYDMYYRNSSGVLTRLANGTTGQVLTATTSAAPSWSAASGGGATTALDNLASVNINSALLFQTGIDIGSTTKPARDLYIVGSGTYGTNYFKLTGTPTSTRTITIPNVTDTLAVVGTNNSFSIKQAFAAGLYTNFNQQAAFGTSNNSITYRTTNGGSDNTPTIIASTNSVVGGELGLGWDVTNGLVFTHANGTRRIASGGINLINLTNTANSEAGDLAFYTQTGGTPMAQNARISAKGNIVLGNEAALSTSATDGYVYFPTCAGVESGTPSSYTGKAACVIDTTNSKIGAYIGGAWKWATLT